MSQRGSLRKRGETWTAYWSVPDVEGDRRQRSKGGFRTRREAAAHLTDVLGAVQAGNYSEPTKLGVAAYLEGWAETLTTIGRAPATISSYRWLIATYIRPAIGGVKLQALQPAHLDKLYADMLAKGLSARTTRYVHSVLRKALGDAVRKGLVNRNVATLADPPSAKSARAPEMAFWTPTELSFFLAAVEGDDLYPLLRLTGLTGMRRGEVCGLLWADVDLDKGQVHVRRQLGVVRRELVFSERPKSDHGRRTIDIDGATVAVLRRHRAAQAERRLAIGVGWQENDLVFCGPAGEPINPDTVSRTFDRRIRKAGVTHIRFHDLRHSHCAHLIAAGRNPKEISRRLGHATVAFTLDRYGHLMPEAGAEAASAVAALVDGTQR